MNRDLPIIHSLAKELSLLPLLESGTTITAKVIQDDIRVVHIITDKYLEERRTAASGRSYGIGKGFSFEIALLRAAVSHKRKLDHDSLYTTAKRSNWAKEMKRHKKLGRKIKSQADKWLIDRNGEIAITLSESGKITCSLNAVDRKGQNYYLIGEGNSLITAMNNALQANRLDFSDWKYTEVQESTKSSVAQFMSSSSNVGNGNVLQNIGSTINKLEATEQPFETKVRIRLDRVTQGDTETSVYML